MTLPAPNPVVGARRASGGHRGLSVGVALLAFLLAVAWMQQGSSRSGIEGRRGQLATLVADRQARAASLEDELRRLRGEIGRVAAAAPESELARLRQAGAALADGAGLSAVEGPGILVELADSSLARHRDARGIDFTIQDVDLQAVANELWREGAEAIAINDQRIVGTTAIRSAGGAVLVNYEVLTSPYRIAAIGDPARLRSAFDASPVAAQFTGWAGSYGLGFRVSGRGRIELPPYRGGLRFRYAQLLRK